MSNVRPFEVMLVKYVALALAKALPGRPSARPANHRDMRMRPHAGARAGCPSHARPALRSLCLHERDAPASSQLTHSSKHKALHRASVNKHNRSRALRLQSRNHAHRCAAALGARSGGMAMGSRLRSQSVSLVLLSTPASSVCSGLRPNPSVNRTSNSGLRPPSAAGYLER